MALLSAETSSKVFKCTKIFELRKGELVEKLEQIDEQELLKNDKNTAVFHRIGTTDNMIIRNLTCKKLFNERIRTGKTK